MVTRHCILCLVYIVAALIRLGEENGGLYKETGSVSSWGDIFNVLIKKIISTQNVLANIILTYITQYLQL